MDHFPRPTNEESDQTTDINLFYGTLSSGVAPLNFEQLGALRFLPLNRKDFPCYDLALTSAEMGDNYSCALNGAGEQAVHAFLREEIPFTAIAETMDYALQRVRRQKANSYDALLETDTQARALANEFIQSKR